MPHVLKIARLLALVLGPMAFSTTATQAEIGAFWEVNGAKLTGAANVQAKNNTAHTTILNIWQLDGRKSYAGRLNSSARRCRERASRVKSITQNARPN